MLFGTTLIKGGTDGHGEGIRYLGRVERQDASF